MVVVVEEAADDLVLAVREHSGLPPFRGFPSDHPSRIEIFSDSINSLFIEPRTCDAPSWFSSGFQLGN